MPIVLFIPGFGHGRQDYTILCEDLASNGYVVMSFDVPYITNFVRYPDGASVVPTLWDLWKIPRDPDYRYKIYDDAMDSSIKDVQFMLNFMPEFNRTRLDGQLDLQNIIIMGHSFGGNVAHTLGFKDKRIKAVVDIDSKITDRAINGRVGVPPNSSKKPVLFIRGMLQYQEDVGYQLTHIEGSDIWEPQVQHSAFSDNAFLAEHIPSLHDIGWFEKIRTWFFKSGPTFDMVDTSLGEYTAARWYKLYRGKVLDFLKFHCPVQGVVTE